MWIGITRYQPLELIRIKSKYNDATGSHFGMNTTAIIRSQQEIVAQCKNFILSVSPEHYRSTVEPHFASPPGKHIRHVIDHYLALKAGCLSGQVNYNRHNRNSLIEVYPEAALQPITDISHWLSTLSHAVLRRQISVVSEISVTEEVHLTCHSTIVRELMFVGSHAVHHYSLIAAILSLQGRPLENTFGLAPATLTYQREHQHTTEQS